MDYLKLVQIVIAISLMISILLQSRGAGVSGLFGGGGNVYMSKRGLEKKLFVATVILSVSFFVISLVNVVL